MIKNTELGELLAFKLRAECLDLYPELKSIQSAEGRVWIRSNEYNMSVPIVCISYRTQNEMIRVSRMRAIWDFPKIDELCKTLKGKKNRTSDGFNWVFSIEQLLEHFGNDPEVAVELF